MSTDVFVDEFDAIFSGPPLMAILRGMGVERSVALAETAWSLGIDAVEIPLQTDEDARALEAVVERAAANGKIVGAGTIISVAQVARAGDLGARYLVSPGFDARLVAAARDRGVPLLPGVATPSDVQAAVGEGLRWLKAFPASWLGPSWFSLVRGPFPGIRFVATGGIDADNARAFLDAGVKVVAVGSALESSDQLPRLAALVGRAAKPERSFADGPAQPS